MRTFRYVCAALLAAFAIAPAQAQDAEYRFGPQDRLRIKVVDWRAGEAEYHEWEALTGEYGVSPGGAISLPLIGMLKAEGATATELSDRISERLQKRAGLATRPDASVEVAQFRPVYVVGDVERPGAYDFRPGLTVLQAVGLAGGVYRPSEAGLIRLERDAITARGLYEIKRQGLLRMLARQARLRTEIAGEAAVKPTPELNESGDATRLIGEEVKIMASRRASLKSQTDALEDLVTLLTKEIASLGAKIATQNAQIATGKRELANIMALVAKGLATNSRQYTLEWQIADLEGKKIDLETSVLRARQEISKAKRDALLLQNTYTAELVDDTQKTDAAIDEFRAAMETQKTLLAEASVTTPQLLASQTASAAADPSYQLIRQVGGAQVETSSDELETLKPGDVLRVRPQSGGAGATSSRAVNPATLQAFGGEAARSAY